MKKYRSKANANIALVKYWGKENEELIIPKNSSLSLTLDSLYTITEVSFIKSDRDEFYLDDKLQGDKETEKISTYIDIFREKSNIQKRVLIKSYNHVPTAAGLASSASGYAALAMGLNKLFELNLSQSEISKLARRGSGSASRSIFGGFVEWVKGDNDDNSYAKKIDDANWDIAMIILVLNENKKKISSREAMKKTIETSPMYEAFTNAQQSDIDNIKIAIDNRDFNKIGEITEHNAMKMHSTIMSSNPPIIYFEESTIKAINKIKELRTKGYSVYYTMDAGPNVKILCKKTESKEIINLLKNDFDNIIYSDVGSDAIVEEI